MQIEIFPVKMQVVCISINTSYVSILSLHKTWDSLVTIILSFEPYNNNPAPHRRFLLSGTPNITFTHSLNVSPQID